MRDHFFSSANIADISVRRLLSVCGKKTSSELWPLSTHEPVKILFLGHKSHKICNNIPRIENNLNENIQRVMSSFSPSAGRLAMDSVIIRRDCKPKDTIPTPSLKWCYEKCNSNWNV